MNRKTLFLLYAVGLILSACGYHYIDMTMGYKHGEYKVVAWNVKAATPKVEASKDYQILKKSLLPKLAKELQGKGAGREITISITIDAAHLTPDLASEIMIAPYSVRSTVEYSDRKTGTKVGQTTVGSDSQAPSLIGDLIGMHTLADLKRFEDQCVDLYVYYLSRAIYPPLPDNKS